MKLNIKILSIVLLAVFTFSAYSKSSKTPKPDKIVKDAVNKTLKQKELKYRITVGNDERIIWIGNTNKKEMRFLGIGFIADGKTGKIVDSDKKRFYYDGKKYLIESKEDKWEAAKSGKIVNFGAKFIKGDLIKSPFDVFNLIKKYSLDEYSFSKDTGKDDDDDEEDDVKDIKDKKPAKNDIIQIVARTLSKKPAKFIDYYSYWKQLKEDEHWKNNKVSDCMVETIFTINKKTSFIKKVKFRYEVTFFCNYGKGDDRCLGCEDAIGDEIVLEFGDDSRFRLELPKSLKRKLGLKDTAEEKGGLKLTLSVNKNRIYKGDALEFDVVWENVSKKELKIKRLLKTNPFIIFEIEGELESRKERFKDEMHKMKQLADDTPLILKAGKTFRKVFIMESDCFLADDQEILEFKIAKYFITVKTQILNGEYVESNSIELEILP
ncbi:MAG: hypothetical protein K8S87_12020 [Planctomycetes bacterium]|nr:hypothetical protein [Planctomycetota bacterium]